MTWRYMNPGLVSLLDSNATATQYTGYEYSRTGYAFTMNNGGYYRGVTLPQFQQGNDFWAKFDVYIPSGASTGVTIRIPNAYEKWLWLSFESSPYSKMLFIYGTHASYYIYFVDDSDLSLGIQRDAVNSFVLHVVYGDASTAKTELLFGVKRYTITGYEVPFRTDSLNKLVALDGSTNTSGVTVKLSNLIFSNEELSPYEQVYVSPTSATTTTMATMTGGMYSATAANQTFLQTPDVSSLISTYGATSKVTGIQVLGNPAYRTGTGLANMIGLSKSGNTLTEHNTCAVGKASTAFISDGWGLSGVTISDVQNMQFGWKAAE